MGLFSLLLKFGFLEKKKMPSLPLAVCTAIVPEGNGWNSCTSFPSSQSQRPASLLRGPAWASPTERLRVPWARGGEVFRSPLGIAALRTRRSPRLRSPLRAEGAKGSTDRDSSPLPGSTFAALPPRCPRPSEDTLWHGLSESSACLARGSSPPLCFSASAGSANLNRQHPPLQLPPAAVLGDRKGAERTYCRTQPTEALQPWTSLPFLHMLWFSQLEIFLTGQQDVIPTQGKPLRQAVVFSLRHFNDPSWREVSWEARTTFQSRVRIKHNIY